MGRGRSGSSDQFQTTQIVSGTGRIGIDEYLVRAEGKLRLDTFGAGPTNDIHIEVKILGSDWQTLDHHIGAQSVSYEVLDWDYVRFNCDVYGGSEFTMYATGFFLIKAEVDTSNLNQEATQLAILDKICDLAASEDGWFEAFANTGEVGTDKSVATSTPVPAGKTRWLNKIDLTSIKDGKFTILKGATIIGSGNRPKDKGFVWLPGYKLNPGETVEVKWEQSRGTNSAVDIYYHGIEK